MRSGVGVWGWGWGFVDSGFLAPGSWVMLRSILGFSKHRGETWEDAHRRMNSRMQKASTLYSIRVWSDELANRKQKLLQRVTADTASHLLHRVFQWSPKDISDLKLDVSPFRGRGRPRATWCQHVTADA